MFAARFTFILIGLVALVTMIAACGPAAQISVETAGSATVVEAPAATSQGAGAGSAVTPVPDEADVAALAASSETPQRPASGAETTGTVVDMTPFADADLAAQPPGRSAAGGASTDPGQVDPGQTEAGGAQPPGPLVAYTDAVFGFGINYPSDYVFRPRAAEYLAQLIPPPVAGFTIMNPVTAASDLGDAEPADLEIRVHPAGGATSLDNWVAANGLLADGTSQPFQTPNAAGLKWCASTMIAPGCSYLFPGNGWIYQLTPATLEGEAMMQTFVAN
ncbi:MAG: hypothetical protein IPK16_22610 [Anaerolineales bacterium]|nr:hypothetical protein [Anaerolineales bacterium]